MRHTSAGLYAVLIACFFLPWFQVGCGIFQVEISGFQLAKGNFEGSLTSPDDIRAFRESLEGKNQGANWWLFFIPIASAAGIVFQLVGFGRLVHFFLSLGCVIIAFGQYIYVRNELFSRLSESSATAWGVTILNIDPALGFWLTVILGGINAVMVKAFSGQPKERSVKRQAVAIKFDPVSPPVKPIPRKSLKEQSEELRRIGRANRSQ